MSATLWSTEAEQSVLGSILQDSRALEACQPLATSDFHDLAHGVIFGAMVALVASGRPSDAVSVAARLGQSLETCGGHQYLDALAVSVPSPRNAGRYAEIVRSKAQHRALVAAADEAMEIAREDGPIADKLERITASLSGIAKTTVKRVPRRLSEIALQRTTHYEALQRGDEVSGWPTHIPTLDRALAGGFRPGKLYFVGARPGVGKSSLSAQLLIEFARDGLPGLMLSQEMAGEEIADRAVANVGRIDYGRLQTGKMTDDDWGRAVEMLESMAQLPVFVDDQPALTLADIRTKARLVPGLKVLVLDYLQLCTGTSGSNRNSEIEEISRGLKAMAMDMGLAVVALSQLSRKVEERPGKRPQLSDLRDSGSIEQDADGVFFLWPIRDMGDGAKLVGMAVAKNRQGRTCDIALDFRGSIQRWTESTESIQDEVRPRSNNKGFDG